MLFRQSTLDGIARGEIDLAFRRWKRPGVRVGTRQRTQIGLVEVLAVDVVDPERITPKQARRAGFASVAALRSALDRRGDAPVYRIEVRYAGEDPRIALRERADLDPDERAELIEHLDRIDGRSRSGPWTREVLRAIQRHPGRRAPDLAAAFEQETRPFKARVRRLKELGLTESLKVGYRLSPRGKAFLEADEG